MLPQPWRKAALTLHVTSSVGWFGAVATFLVLAVIGLRTRDAGEVRAAALAMNAAVRLVILPLALGALATGLVSSLGTSWGLVRHYWVLVKFLLIGAATVVLLQLRPIADLAQAAARTPMPDGAVAKALLSQVVHAGGGLLVLLTATVLSIFKPRGLTAYGRRRAAALDLATRRPRRARPSARA
jgi:hypothetical protein